MGGGKCRIDERHGGMKVGGVYPGDKDMDQGVKWHDAKECTCKRFPQKLASRTSSDGDVAGTFYELLQDWPEDVSESLVWDEETRKQLNEHKLSDYQLTKRREQVI